MQPHYERIVLLHGMGGTGSLWRPLAIALENHPISILSPDQRGHGKSQIAYSTHYSALEYGKDLIETLEEACFSPTWILGHSMGVRSAVAAAFLQPERVKGLFLIDLGFSGLAGGSLGENLIQFLKQLPPYFSSQQEARDFMQRECPDRSMAQYLMAVATLDTDGKLLFPFDRSALIQTAEEAKAAPPIRTWIQALGLQGVPMWIFRGAESKVWSHSDFQEEKQALSKFPSLHFEEVEKAGHGLPFERREWLAKKIATVLSLHSNRG